MMDHKIEVSAKASRPDARILRSREALRSALVSLLGEQDFSDLTVTGLAKRAGVGYATFFRHYADKEELLAEIADDLVADLTRRMAPPVMAGEAVRAAEELVDRVQADEPLFRALLLGAGESFRRKMIDRTTAMALAWHADDALGDLPRDLAVRHMVSATLTVLSWWLQEPRGLPPDELRALIRRLVIDPVSTGIR